jgi:hypothetical protein
MKKMDVQGIPMDLSIPRTPKNVQIGPLELSVVLYGEQGSEGGDPAKECIWRLPNEAR